MKRRYSLKRNKDFQRVYRQGRSAGAKAVVLLYRKDNHRSVRAGFSVSKKVGKAVVRNKVKRRMREAFTPHIPSLKPGYSLIFIARQNAAQLPYSDIASSVKKALERAGLLIGEGGADRGARRCSKSC